ncbi:hypothetical protein QOZ80_6BG0480020 [Eleusine coracana subsp. coracana]|nr:hypothetical protein QOZ80_6BG0480020 [Eleusine coracana subsp. coracana]
MMQGAIALLWFSLLCLCSHAWMPQGSSSSINATADELALLNFKSMLSSPSDGLLASWNTTSHFCSWAGVSCSRRHPERVISLLMNSFNLSGRISPFLGNLSFLRELDLGGNQLVGEIPADLGRLIRLQALNLSFNQLQGEIPTEIGLGLKNLINLNLGSNSFSGEIPWSLADLPLLKHFTLSDNKLSGEIPPNLGNLTNLKVLQLDLNTLSGAIPSSLGQLPSLSWLTLGANNLSGPIPDSLWNISTLTTYSVQQNMLNGSIPPDAFNNLPYLQNIYMDRNHFHGPIPRSIGVQDDGIRSLVAVKVLKLQTPGAIKSFIAECEALRNMRHRNLVKVVTACASIDDRGNDFKAIVYEFMPNGSLEGWLHPEINEQSEHRYLDLTKRVNILLDVAYALHYLHCDGPMPVIHCDLKSSNVLLDADMVAQVGDFGLAKVIVEGSPIVQQSTSTMGFRGTIGYAAPEYGAGNVVSTNGDIYSYGILVLEMVTGKRPTDSTLRQGSSLREYVELALHNRTMMDVIDTRMSLSLRDEVEDVGKEGHETKINCLIALLRVGLSCSDEMPSSRMSTGDIIKELLAIQGSLLNL